MPALQLFLPRWVRGHGLSVYQMVLFGAQAAGAAIWGDLQDRDDAAALSDPPPQTDHYLTTDVRE